MFGRADKQGQCSLRWVLVLYMAAAFLFAGCGDDAEDNGGDDGVSGLYHGEQGLSIDAAFSPDPPRQGDVDLSLDMTIDDEALEGAEIIVEPWMPSHGHGSNTDALVHEEGDGLYRVDDLSFSMPGHWELEIDVEWGEHSSTVVIDIDVEG